MESAPADKSNKKQSPKEENFFIEVLKFALLAAIIVIPFRLFVAEPYVVQGASMSPTFETWHYLIIDKVSHRAGSLERGDVVVFSYPNDPSKSFVKRIIALPGETIRVDGQDVSIKEVGSDTFRLIEEPFVKNSYQSNVETELSGDEYFVMGDNRRNSSDSRFWGPLNKSFIKGEALLRLLPLNQIGAQPGDYTIEFKD